jgi:hypothetical protein
MVTAGQAEEAAVVAPRTRILAFQGARLRGWKTVLIQSLGRELNALQRQQQERAFMATTHGLNYSAAGSRSAALH